MTALPYVDILNGNRALEKVMMHPLA